MKLKKLFNMIKIIGGKFKRNNLEVPNRNVRPTSSIKRESIFSVIESYAYKNSFNLYGNNAVLDIFAGSGSIGLEAISRGMKKAYFYENDINVIQILKKNCKKICKKNSFEILQNDVMIFSPDKISLPVSLIFIDPPYNKYDISNLLTKLILKKIIQKNTLTVFETHKNDNFNTIPELKVFNKKSFGKTFLYFLKKLS